MLDKSFGLLFYWKKPKNYVKGVIPIYLRITVDGVHKELSTKRTCDPDRWNSALLRQVRNVFLFCCFTGLAYVDIKKLNASEVSVGVDNELWIFTRRGKTNSPSRIPLLPASQKILNVCKNHPKCINSKRLLPILSNQKYNSYLKELAVEYPRT